MDPWEVQCELCQTNYYRKGVSYHNCKHRGSGASKAEAVIMMERNCRREDRPFEKKTECLEYKVVRQPLDHDDHDDHERVPPPGYKEFRRRMEIGLNELPGAELPKTPVTDWVQYLMSHCAGNTNGQAGYSAFRRRLEERVLDAGHRAALTDDGSVEAKWVLYLFQHCAGNPDNAAGYAEWRRRAEDVYSQVAQDLDGRYHAGFAQASWVRYLFQHLVGNPPVLD